MSQVRAADPMTPTQRKALHRYAVAEYAANESEFPTTSQHFDAAIAKDELQREFSGTQLVSDWLSRAALAELGRVLSESSIPVRGTVR